jgi:NAD(P)-dependent dehydrogenase (short-subunit alcohol dehydrogenase family)
VRCHTPKDDALVSTARDSFISSYLHLTLHCSLPSFATPHRNATGTVVAMDRNSAGLEALQKALIKDYSDSSSDDARDRILMIPTYHEDLASVKEASEIIISRFGQVDLLVNNAGLSYSKDAKTSAHGKDLAFTVNYLSHFLLTEKLLQSLSNGGRIVHVTSSFHWKVDGSELLPDPENGIPLAYQSDPKLQSPKHVERSYPNTKLAQIWHSRSIAAEALPRGVRCSSVCACPTWAATGIAGKEGKNFLEKYAFPVSDCGPGITSAINGMFRTDEELGDALNDGTSFVANSRILENLFPRTLLASKFMTNILGWRDFNSNVVGFIMLFFQKYTHDDFIIQQTSPESFEDKEKRDRFYQWSKDEVKIWL